MRVSVIVPLLNKAPFVTRSLDSIASQSLSDFEVIIVDGGSTDGSDELAARFRDRRFRVVSQPDDGPGTARNRGIAQAEGAYVAFLDADDVWLPTYLEHSVGVLDAYPSVVSVSGAWIDYPKGTPVGPVWSARGVPYGAHRVTAPTPVTILDVMDKFMNPSTTVMRTDVARRLGGFQEGSCFGEDSTLWMKLLLNCPLFFHFESLVEFHREASELSGNYTGPRPIEPYLLTPVILRSACRPEMLPLLERFLTERACKAACMLSYWGDWRGARALTNKFVSFRDFSGPLFGPALVAGTPLGAVAGALFRKLGFCPRSSSTG
jgi:glycosyl transferase family 2